MPPLRRRIEEFLDAHHVMSLATAGAAGAAGEPVVHAASVMYARRGLVLYWTSDPRTRHSRQAARDGRVSVTIAPDYSDFRAIRGLQLAGEAARLEGPEALEARALLVRRYAFLAELDAGPPELRAALEKASFYRLRPACITLIDNSLGFGHRETLDCTA